MTCAQVFDDICSHPYKIRLPSHSHWHASEPRSCVKMEEAVLRSPSLIVLVASVDVKQHSTGTQSLTLISRPPWGPFPTSGFHFTHLRHHAIPVPTFSFHLYLISPVQLSSKYTRYNRSLWRSRHIFQHLSILCNKIVFPHPVLCACMFIIILTDLKYTSGSQLV